MLKAFLALALLLTPAAAGEALRLRPGARTTLRLTENPSTGYTWRLDAAASAGLDHVAVEDGGHQRGRNMPGAPGQRLWTLRALTPGTATVAFAYQRPWEPAPVETRVFIIEVAGY
jgi:inhibitor of cysteine peptidase